MVHLQLLVRTVVPEKGRLHVVALIQREIVC